MKIKIVTQTGSNFPLDEAERLGITVLPDILIFDGVEYKNVYELTAEEFYEKLKTVDKLPTSSYPHVSDFVDTFVELSKDADEIIFFAVTSKMSGSYSAALTASEMAREAGAQCPIYVYDTLQVSHPMRLMIYEAYRLAEAGLSATEIIGKMEEYRHKMGCYFILGSLKYAKMGGRVGVIKALAADAMGIKPLMVFDDGVVKDIGIARNMDDGIDKVIAKYKEEADFSQPVIVIHEAAPNVAATLESKIKAVNPDAQITIDYEGPVVGMYAGPGGGGIAFVKK
ncbi:MAG: DegV family protein [Eubacterium sp.]|nr:DegV family protein [Candidatus Colimonas fimequi]